MTKRLIIVRHAHRDISNREADNGLSKKGKKQARRVLDFYKRAFADGRPLILTSPKKRCVETLEGVARSAGVRLVMDNRLLDLSGREEKQSRPKRVVDFLTWWKDQAPALTIACSHGGWIDSLLKLSAGANSGLKKGGWAEIFLRNDKVELTWLIQSFKNLL